MKYLITGANGFIGGSLAKFLLATGNDVTAFSRKFHDDTKKELSGAKFLTGDVLDYNFSKQFQFNLDPTFKYQINTFNNTSGNFKPFIVGVYTGLSFKF
mgnify:CR=1 FL=1